MDIKTLKKCIAKRSVLPVLRGVKLEPWSIGSITATDMEVYMIDTPNFEVKEPCVIDAKLFEVMYGMGIQDMQLLDGYKMLFTLANGASAEVEYIDIEEYVACPNIDREEAQKNDKVAIVERDILVAGLEHTIFAVKQKNITPVLTGIHVEVRPGSINFIGTDSFRLAHYESKREFLGGNFDIIIPVSHASVLLSMLKNCKKQDGGVMLIATDNMLKVLAEDKILQMLLVIGKFPQWRNENIVPTTYEYSITYTVAELKKAISDLGKLTGTKKGDLYVDWYIDGMDTMESGQKFKVYFSEKERTELRAMPLFWLNVKYLLGFLETPEIKMAGAVDILVNSREKPIVIKPVMRPVGGVEYTYVVRPLLK